MKILIVDDHPLFLTGLRETLLDSPGAPLELLQANDATQALQALGEHPDINWVCVDLQMPGDDGFSLMAQIRAAGHTTPMAVLSGNEHPVMVERALEAGAIGYISKSASANELRAAFVALRDQGYYLSANIRRALDEYRAGYVSLDGERVKFTRRQREVLALVAAGYPNQVIAERLHLAESTVKAHVSTLFDLLKVDNRAACVRAAVLSGAVDLGAPN